MSKLEEKLGDLMLDDSIWEYKIEKVDSFNNGSRIYHVLTLTFWNGKTLSINSWCSGTNENSGFSLYIEE